MKKIILNQLFIVIASIFVFSSCDLTREPYDAIPRENSLQTIADAQKWDVGFMSQLRNRVGGVYSVLQDYQADYLNASGDFGNRGGAWYTWQTLNSSDYDVKDIWHNYYMAIKNINEFLSLADNLKLTTDAEIKSMNQYKGDAHLLRAYYYSELAIRYGYRYNPNTANTDLSVPLILKYDLNELPSRATNEQVYAQIKKDIETAKTLLVGRKNAPMSEYLNTDAAVALQARVALTMKNWSEALLAAETLINSGRYPLVKPEKQSFIDMWYGDKSSEDIIQLYVKKTDEEPNVISFYGYNESQKAFMPDWFPTQGFIDLYATNDLRKNIYFEKVGLTKVGDYEMNDLYVISKFKGNPVYNNTATPRYIIKPKLFRMGEIYMIAAEAAFMSGNTTKATQYLNDFRYSRGLIALTSVTMQDIKDERSRELAYEGFRLWDLRRWEDPMNRFTPQYSNNEISGVKIGTTFLSTISPFNLKIQANSPRWIWPIPYNDLTTNVNIKDQQNPGW